MSTSPKSAIKIRANEDLRNKDLVTYSRQLFVLAALLLPLFGILHKTVNPDVTDPMAERIIISLFFLSVFVLSFLVEYVKKHLLYFTYLLFYILSIWTVSILVLNQFIVDYTYGLIVVIFGSVGLKKHTHLAVYFLIMISLVTVACFLVTEPKINKTLLVGSLAVAGLVTYIVFSSRIRLEEELISSEELLKAIFNESADALFLVDPDSLRIFDCNDRAASLFLVESRDELIDVDLSSLQKQPQDLVQGHDQKPTPHPVVLAGEREFVTKKDREFWGDLAVRKINVRDAPVLLVRISDITERKRAEEALLQSEERHRSLVENTLDGYFIFDVLGGKYLFLNQRFCELFGYSPEEALELSVSDLIATEDHGRIHKRLQAWTEGQLVDPEPQIYKVVRRDSSVFRAEVSMSLVSFQGVPAIQGTLRDVTEREQLQRQLQHAQKMQAVGTLAGGVAHEFNNILAGIQGYTQLMILELESDHPTAEHLYNIEDSCHRAATLTQKMLTFSRLEEGEKLPVKVNHSVTGVQQLLRPTLPPHIEVNLTLQRDLPFAMADPSQLEQVLLNLTVNAIDALTEPGSIWFRTRTVDIDETFCRTHPWAKTGHYIEIAVEDTGEGMSQDTLEHAFEPFFTTKEPGKGTGLGLSIAYSIVKNHRGYILAESEEGRGSRIRILLPVKLEKMQEAGSGVTKSKPLPRGNGESVLLVDDEPHLREIARHILTAKGYRVATAADGEEALRMVRQALEYGRPFDLVMLDLAMPVMDGEACLSQLRQIAPNAKVLLSTGYSGDAVHTSRLRNGIQDVLMKPYDFATMLKRIRLILGKPDSLEEPHPITPKSLPVT